MTQTSPKKIRMRKWNIDDVIDARALQARIDSSLTDSIADPSEARMAVLDHLQGALFRGRMIAQERLQQGADGLDTARLLSAVQDVVIGSLHFYLEALAKQTGEKGLENVSIIATGGYGRGVLAPNSDIDLLFLSPKADDKDTNAQIEKLLYCLWDLKLKIGYATRNINECLKLSDDDVTIKTALLDARYVCGNRELFDKFQSSFDSKVRGNGGETFIQQKLEERESQHSKTGHSPYVVEPEIKNGMGGLRDLQTLFWITKFYNGGTYFEDVLKQGGFSDKEMRVFMDAARFFWTLRCHLHFLTGRGEDRLSFDVQPEIAQRMRYHDTKGQLGVERLMKRYFSLAKEVGILMRIFAARMGADMETSFGGFMRQLSEAVPSALSRPNLPEGLSYKQGKIFAADADVFEQNPAICVEIFLLARDHNFSVHPQTLSDMRRRVLKIPMTVVKAEPVASALLDAITGSDVERVLRQLSEAGVLGRFIPEYGQIIAQTQFNMYHHFTIDEHTLRAVGGLADMEAGNWQVAKAPTVFSRIKNRRALYLAMLLHDTGKGQGDQQVLGEKTSMAACKRLGLDASETQLVGWLVRNHLEMSEVAQKRDISDPRTILDFSRRVQTTERLNLLYLLTCADINAVGPGVFNTWKGQLLAELHGATASILRGGRTEEASIAAYLAEQASAKQAKLLETTKSLPAIMQNLETAYWLSIDDERQVQHAVWLENASEVELATHLSYSETHRLAELVVKGTNQAGVFARLVSAIAQVGGNVISAYAFTDQGQGEAFFDVFYIDLNSQSVSGSDLSRWNAEIQNILSSHQTGKTPHTKIYDHARKRRAAFIVKPEVNLHENLSETSAVLEVSATNEPGVLAAICETIVAANMSIMSAHISTFGERVFDVFYVQNLDGSKPSDPSINSELEAHLSTTLAAFGKAKPKTAIRTLERSESAKSY